MKHALVRIGSAIGIALCLLTTHGVAQDLDAAAKRFGKLPARFNGRLTTIESVAQYYLRTVSGRPYLIGTEGDKRPAATVLFDWFAEASAGNKHRVMRIENPQLLAALKLKPRVDGPTADLYSIDEIQPQLNALQAAAERARSSPPADRSKLDAAAFGLAVALGNVTQLRLAHSQPSAKNQQELQAMVTRLRRLVTSTSPLPFIAPPAKPGAAWGLYFHGALVNFVIQAGIEKGISPNEGVTHLTSILKARNKGDSAAVEKALKKYESFLKKNGLTQSAYQFSLPEGWREIGSSPANARMATYHSDLLAHGGAVSIFEIPGEPASAFARVTYFGTPTAPNHRIINSWRLSSRLAPLPADQTEELAQPATVAGQKALRVTLRSPRDPTASQIAITDAYIMRRGSETWTLTMFGPPPVVEANQRAMQALAAGIRLGSVEAVRNWFGFSLKNRPKRQSYDKQGMQLVALAAGDRLWSIICGSFSVDDALAVGEFGKLLRSLDLEELKKAKPDLMRVGARLPEKWKSNGPLAYQIQTEKGGLLVRINVLSEYRPESLLPLVNHWRTDVNQPTLTAAELRASKKAVQVGQLKLPYFKLLSPKKVEAAAEKKKPARP